MQVETEHSKPQGTLMITIHPFKTTCVLGLLLSIAPVLTRALQREDVERVKNATAYVVVGEERSATAFAIAPGLFVTSNHVFRTLENEPIHLVLHSSTENEIRFPARILRRSEDADLALLKIEVEEKPSHPFLALGQVNDLFETQTMIAFGFPFGNMLSLQNQEYPSVSVNMGRITSLGMQEGLLQRIQLDAQLNPGNSGGPVLNEQGQVVGVVSSGVAGAGVNFAIPVSKLHPLLEAPDVTMGVPKLSPVSLHESSEVTARLNWILEAPEEVEVRLTVEAGEQSQSHVLAPGEDGLYAVQVIPFPDAGTDPQPTLRVRVSYPNGGELRGLAHARDLQLGDENVSLQRIRSITMGEEVEVVRRDTEAWRGPAPVFEALEVILGEETFEIRPEFASRIQIVPIPLELPVLRYRCTIHGDGKLLYETEGTWNIEVAESELAETVQELSVEHAPAVTGVQEITLPSPVHGLDMAGDGRYLLLYLPEVRRLARFDNTELRITGYINLQESEVVFAGGASHVLVHYPETNLFARYSLETLERERAITNPFGAIDQIAIGFSSSRLAMVMEAENRHGRNPHMFDLLRMQPIDLQRGTLHGMSIRERNILHASADGRVYASRGTSSSPSGVTVFQYRDGALNAMYEHASWGSILPGPDGTRIYTTSAGIYSVNLHPLLPKNQNNRNLPVAFLPSTDPMYFISVPRQNRHSSDASRHRLEIYMSDQEHPLLSLSDPFDEMRLSSTGRVIGGRTGLELEVRYHFIPQLNLLLTLPETNDRIFARNLDVQEILEEKGIDYFYIASRPPTARPASLYQYQVRAMSKADGVAFHLETGPEGLTVSKNGLLQWETPETLREESVIMRVTNGIGQTIHHTFRIPTAE